MAFDENHYKQIFEQRYGSGSFDSGLKQARQVGQLKVQAEVAKKDYTARLKAQQAAAKKAQRDAEKAQKAAQQQEKVYGGMTAKEANSMQKKAQAEGRGGYQPSYANMRKEAKVTKDEGLSLYTATPSTYDANKLTPYARQQLGYPSLDALTQTTQKSNPKKDKTSLLGKIGEIIDRPGDAVRTGIKEATQGHSFLKGLEDGFTGKKNTSGKDVIKSLGFDASKNKIDSAIANFVARGLVSEQPGMGISTPSLSKKLNNKIGTGTLGVGTEIALDPLNLLGTGIATKSIKGLGELSKLSKLTKGTKVADELLGLPAPQLRLNSPQLQLSAPKSLKLLEALMQAGKKPIGAESPIPSMPKPMSQAFTKSNLENKGLNFAQSSKYNPKARPTTTGIERQIDPLNRGQAYWQKRYEDFTKFAKDKGYNSNNSSQESIQELWTHFAKYDEPVDINQVVDMAYPKGYEAPPIPKAPKQENPLIAALRNDPKINEKIKGFFPPVRPEPKVNRPATLQEMFQNLRDIAPPSKPTVEPTPLQFRVQKGFNPNTPTNILNRSSAAPKGLEAISKGKLKSLAVSPKDITAPQDAHGYGLIDTQASKPVDYNNKTDLENRLALLREDVKQPSTKVKKDAIRKEILSIRQGLDNLKQKSLTESDHTFNDLIANSDNWKDKPSPLLKRETMVRNFEDVMGPQDSKKVKELILNPIGREEAKSVKFKNAERSLVSDYKIKGNTKDSSLTQKYGEGLISLNELKDQTSNWKDVVKLTEHMRKTYDKIFPMMNKTLVEHGYPTVPYRKNYFPHTQDLTTFEKILKEHVGIDFVDHTLPTDINGLTGNFKPGKQFFGNTLKRTGDKTAYDAIAAFDKYLEGSSNVIFHTKNIKRLRGFENAIRMKYKGKDQLSNFAGELEQFTNALAGKKVGLDHSFEKYTGRQLYSFVDNMRKRTAGNMLAFNTSSSLTNLIPALTQAPALVGKKYFLKGMSDTLANVVKKDGFETDFLTRRIGSDPLYRTLWGNVTDKGFWLMKTIDKFASQTIVRSKYYELTDKGMAPNVAKQQADEFASKIMADRSKGQMPTLFADRTLSLFTQFQLEANNQISIMTKDIPRLSKNKKAMASAYAQVFLYSYLFNNMFEKVTGRRPALDPVGVVKNAIGDYNNSSLSKGNATWNTVQNVGNQLPFTSMFTGGRFPIEAGLPNFKDWAQGKSTWGKELAKPATYLVPPTGGGQMRKLFQTATDFGANPLSPQGTTGYYKTNKAGEKNLQHPIERSVPKLLQEGLFGRSSLQENRDFYNKQEKALSPKQTKQIENSPNPIGSFQALTKQRRMTTLKNNLNKDFKKNLTPKERQQKLADFLEQMKKLKEGN